MRYAPSRSTMFFATLLACVVALSPFTTSAQPAAGDNGMVTVAVAGVASYDNLLSDIDYLGSFAGRPKSGQMIEGTIVLFTQGKGLVGLDKTRPWGVVLRTDGAQFVPLVCLPINDLDAILDLLIGFQIQSEDLGGGVFEITAPTQTMYAKQAGEWVYVGQTEEALDSAPANPQGALTALVEDYDLGARVLVKNVPPAYKQLAIQQLRAGFEAGLERLPGETDEDFAKRRELGNAQVQQFEDAINDLSELTFGWNVDSEGERSYLDMIVTAVEGSDAATQLAILQSGTSRLTGFIDNKAAMTMSMATQFPPDIAAKEAKRIETQFEDLKTQIKTMSDLQGDLSNNQLEILMGVFDAFRESWIATVLKGSINSAMTIDINAEQFLGYGAMKLEKTDLVQKTLRELDAEGRVTSDNYPGFEWDADSYNGVTYHLLEIPTPAGEANAQAIFGPTLKVWLGFSKDHAYFALGDDGLAKTKAAIDASAAAGPVEAKPMEMVVSLAAVMEFAKTVDQSDNAAMMAMIADLLADAGGQDHLRLTVDPVPNGARYRLEAEKGVLKAFGAAAVAAQQAQQQQQQGF